MTSIVSPWRSIFVAALMLAVPAHRVSSRASSIVCHRHRQSWQPVRARRRDSHVRWRLERSGDSLPRQRHRRASRSPSRRDAGQGRADRRVIAHDRRRAPHRQRPASSKTGRRKTDGVALKGRHCRLTESAIVGWHYKFFVHLFGPSNRVDHCYLAGKTSESPTLQVEAEGQRRTIIASTTTTSARVRRWGATAARRSASATATNR